MKTEKTIGWLLIAGAMGVFIPYTILTIIFDYPDILRSETGIILTKFHAGGGRLEQGIFLMYKPALKVGIMQQRLF